MSVIEKIAGWKLLMLGMAGSPGVQEWVRNNLIRIIEVTIILFIFIYNMHSALEKQEIIIQKIQDQITELKTSIDDLESHIANVRIDLAVLKSETQNVKEGLAAHSAERENKKE